MATDLPNDRNQVDNEPEILEKIVEQFTARLRAGEHPAIAEYQEAYPDLKDEIEDLLASVAMIEQLKSNPGNSEVKNRRSLEEVSSLEQIGDYRIEREIGRGGMGVVFEAIHESLGRRVAIKVVPTPLIHGNRIVERFKREAQSAARLHHTNIVGVFGVGEGDGYHYYVMDFVDGQTLSEVIFGLSHSSDTRPTRRIERTRRNVTIDKDSAPRVGSDSANDLALAMDPPNTANQLANRSQPQMARTKTPQHFRWAARIGANIADALSYAHAANILHRDIKPSNIILDRKGIVWITDFGLAKDDSSEINLTKTGDVIGTPQYLAPESLEGTYDQRSEVYCLGLTLYELATLQPAYRTGTTAEVIRNIATSSPISPRKINPRIPIDLGIIIEKAVSRDPRSRYATAQEMRNDLQAFVADQPIMARPPSSLELVLKWSRRNPLTAGLAAVSSLLLTLVAVSASVGYLYTTDALTKEANKSARLQIQQKETEHQRRAAVIARKDAEEFASKMEAQYARAEANIEVTIKAFDEMFRQVVARGASVDGEVDIDGFEELMGIETSLTQDDAEFLEKLLAFYDQFATQNADNESLRKESARAFRRVANIYQLIGDAERAIDAYQESIQLYEQIWMQTPRSKEALIALVQTKNELSRSYRSQDARKAFEQYKSAKALLDQVPVEQLDDELRLEKAKTLNSLGSSAAMATVMFNSASYRERPPRPRTSDDRNSQGSRMPDSRQLPGWLEGYLRSLPRPGARGPAFNGRGGSGRRPERGPERGPGGVSPALGQLTNFYSKEALEILNELIDRSPEKTEYRWVRANCYCNLAATLLGPDPRRAREMRNLAIEELESLIELDPDNSGYQYRLVMACSLGNPADETPSERQLFARSVNISRELVGQFPQVLDYHLLYGSVCTQQSGRQIARGELEAALESLKTAKSSFDYVGEKSPLDRTIKRTQGVIGSQFHALIAAAEAAGQQEIAREAKSLLTQIRLRPGSRGRRRPPGQ